MKGKRMWTRWFADRVGFGGKDWAEDWYSELRAANLPGGDFLVFAANGAMDAWLPRPAEYSDARRALHLLLLLSCRLNAEQAVEYNPHGFRHILVSAGQQLKAFGVVSEGDLDKLGHWARGSAMPGRYDSASGVSELRARTALLKVIRTGWRPAKEGELPVPVSCAPASPGFDRRSGGEGGFGVAGAVPVSIGSVAGVSLPSSVSIGGLELSSGGASLPLVPQSGFDLVGVPPPRGFDPRGVVPAASLPPPMPASAVDTPSRVGGDVALDLMVAHKKSKIAHIRTLVSESRACTSWGCGTLAAPTPMAICSSIPPDWQRCRICFR